MQDLLSVRQCAPVKKENILNLLLIVILFAINYNKHFTEREIYSIILKAASNAGNNNHIYKHDTQEE